MTSTTTHSPILRWWLSFTVVSLAAVVLVGSGLLHRINEADVTKISFLIIAVLIVFTLGQA